MKPTVKAALFVDDLVGSNKLWSKTLNQKLSQDSGISGATILGDGGVSLILDVGALLRGVRTV